MDGAQWVVDKTFDGGGVDAGVEGALFISFALLCFPTHCAKDAQWMGHSGLSIKLLTVGC